MPDIDFQRIELNLIPKKGDEPVIFYASQYETTRPFIADLMWGETAFTPGDDCWAEIDIRKNDDNLVVITDDVAIDNNEVSVILPVQALTCIGKNLGQVKIYAGEDQLIAALNFILEVQPDPLAGGVTSETAIDNLTEQIEEITQQVIGDDYYDKTEVDGLLAGKADQSTTYSKTEVDNALNLKADKSTTYTKSQVDSALALKADASSVYTKGQTDTLLNAKANTADLATVATTGSYDDLTDKPTIPAAQVQSDYAQADSSAVDYIKNKPDLSVYATNDDLADAIFGLLPTDSASGAIANFTTEIGADLVDCKSYIVASQQSGTPTPSSPLPISGYTEANITRCGVNLLHVNSRIDATQAQVHYTSDDNYIYLNGTKSGGGYADMSNLTMTLPRGTYYLKAFVISGTASNTVELYAYDGINNLTGSLLSGEKTLTLTELTTFRFRFAVWSDGTVLTDYKVGIVITTASGISAFTPYNGSTVTIAFGQTVYGGVLDVTRGKLTVTHANIASYNGESINEPWLSSMDVYVPNTTPTTGAQVVYPLTTPFDIDLTPVQINALMGVNNLYNDTNGDTEVSYKDDIQHYIDTRI